VRSDDDEIVNPTNFNLIQKDINTNDSLDNISNQNTIHFFSNFISTDSINNCSFHYDSEESDDLIVLIIMI